MGRTVVISWPSPKRSFQPHSQARRDCSPFLRGSTSQSPRRLGKLNGHRAYHQNDGGKPRIIKSRNTEFRKNSDIINKCAILQQTQTASDVQSSLR